MKMKKNPIVESLFLALVEIVYVFLIALIMKNGNQLFGNVDTLLSVAVFLLLFVLSAAISGVLIFGKPILLYLDKKKKEALQMLGYIIGWLLAFVFVFFLVLALAF